MDQLINNGTTLPANPGLNSAPIRALDAACVNNSSSKRIPLKRRPRIRMLDSMIESGAFEIEPYRPIATSKNFIFSKLLEDRTLEKEKLQNLMAGEEELKQHKSKNIEFIDDEEELDERKMCKFIVIMIVIQEIKERRAWLDEMTALNKGDKFKHQIESEIAIVCIFLKLIIEIKSNPVVEFRKIKLIITDANF